MVFNFPTVPAYAPSMYTSASLTLCQISLRQSQSRTRNNRMDRDTGPVRRIAPPEARPDEDAKLGVRKPQEAPSSLRPLCKFINIFS